MSVGGASLGVASAAALGSAVVTGTLTVGLTAVGSTCSALGGLGGSLVSMAARHSTRALLGATAAPEGLVAATSTAVGYASQSSIAAAQGAAGVALNVASQAGETAFQPLPVMRPACPWWPRPLVRRSLTLDIAPYTSWVGKARSHVRRDSLSGTRVNGIQSTAGENPICTGCQTSGRCRRSLAKCPLSHPFPGSRSFPSVGMCRESLRGAA